MPGSIKSQFQFKSYKIVNFTFKINPDIRIMKNNYFFAPEMVNFSIGFGEVEKTINNSTTMYTGGIGVKFELLGEKKESVAQGVVELTGVFETKGLDSESEKSLATTQIPALLFPYARAAITSILSVSGFGTVILPLINVQEMAKNAKIEIIESESNLNQSNP